MTLPIEDVPDNQKFLCYVISPKKKLMAKTCGNFNLVTVPMASPRSADLT